MKHIHLDEQDPITSFWALADITKASAKYKIDKNLQSLKFAPLQTLKKIFIQYRFFTHYYITDLAILISKLPFGKLKSILSEILFEELGNGKPQAAHPQLYDDFLASLGIPNEQFHQADAYCLQNLQSIQTSLHHQSWAYGIGLRGMGGECLCQIYLSAMHAYFSQNLAIIGMQERIAWTFWDIHIGEVDLHHQELIRTAINELILDKPYVKQDLIHGYLESKTAWDLYWEQIFRAARLSSTTQTGVTYARCDAN